ncbi:hypothetical protein [Actinoplanes sp. NPDC051494]|uniref:hypothetical protein n=1 Tax=Actinoplanes sp. NPDC051494 TaxID=3363907 RepID=UPI0037BCB7D8
MSRPEWHDDLAAIAEHGSRTVLPQPVAAILRQGHRRRRNQRIAGALGLVLVAGAGTAVALSAVREQAPETGPGPAPAAAPTVSPPPDGVLDGTRAFSIRLVKGTGTEVVAGYDDDDRVIAETERGKDYELRNKWHLEPSPGGYLVVQTTKRNGNDMCMTVDEYSSVRMRVCKSGADVQELTLTPDLAAQAYTLGLEGTPLHIDTDDGIVAQGSGEVVTFRFEVAG